MRKILALTAGAVLVAGSAMAVPVLDFNMDATHGANGGSIIYSGGAAPLVGTNIEVDDVLLVGVAGSQTALSGAVLNFTTGAFSSITSVGPADIYSFLGGGEITVVGGVPDAGIEDGTTLIEGAFNYAQVSALGGGSFMVTVASFLDIKDADLLEYFGLPAISAEIPYYSGNMNLSFAATINSDTKAFVSTAVYSGDITNSPVPEPTTMLLLGTGLLGLAGVTRRTSLSITHT